MVGIEYERNLLKQVALNIQNWFGHIKINQEQKWIGPKEEEDL